MKRSALVGAALSATVAAILTIGITTASAAPKIYFSPLYVSIADRSAVEGQMGAPKLSVVRQLSPLPGFPDTHIYWKTVGGGTGMPGTDYASQSGVKTLVRGQVATDVMVGSIDDNIYQLSHQPVTVRLDGASNVWTTLLPADYDGTIPTSVTIPPYASSSSFTIHTHDDITQTYKVMWIWMTGTTNANMPAYDYGTPADQLDCWGYGTVWDEGY
jgi:hypothetical protein